MFDDVWKNIAPGEERTFSDESVIGYRIGKEGESYWFGLKGNFNPDELMSVENSLEHLRLSYEKTEDNKNYLKILPFFLVLCFGFSTNVTLSISCLTIISKGSSCFSF